MSPDARSRVFAAGHHGMIHRDELRRAGLSDTQIQIRIRRGDLIRRHPRVYQLAGAPLTLRARIWAALLACGRDAFASHWPAAVLWAIRRGDPELIDITVVGDRRVRLDGVRVHRCASRPSGELRRRDGLPLSSPARTICELAAGEPRDTVEYAIQEAAARLRLTPQELSLAAERWRPRPGSRMLQAILQEEGEDEFTRAWTERRLRWILRTAKLPLPDNTNLNICGHRCDAVWHDQRLIVEVDGIGTHGTPVAFAADRAMDVQLTLAGWRVLRFTARQLEGDPLRVAAQLAQALRAPV